jgi:hypothetical protein
VQVTSLRPQMNVESLSGPCRLRVLQPGVRQ